jgi:DNA repair ATPase RecN
MQDHDLLIQLHTKLDNLASDLGVLKEFDVRLRDIESKDQRHSERITNLMTEMNYVKQTTVQLARINAIEEDVKTLKAKQITTDRIDAIANDVADLKKKSNLFDAILGIGTVITGLISYFK